MNTRRSRLQRKAARIEKTDLERTLDRDLAAVRRERDEALAEAAAEYRRAVAEAHEAQTKARKAANERYEEQRTKTIKSLAKKETAAA